MISHVRDVHGRSCNASTVGRPRQGRFFGVPYDWRRPSAARTKQRAWKPDEPRLLVPKSFGWGWGINFARLFGRKPKI
jgi:hypothetical protein